MFRVHEAVPGEEMEEVEVVEVVEVRIIITSNLEPNNQSDGAAAPPELDSDPQQTHTAPSERERSRGACAVEATVPRASTLRVRCGQAESGSVVGQDLARTHGDTVRHREAP